MKNNAIIIIDDDEDDVDLIRDAFKEIGLQNEIFTFNDGRQAYNFFQSMTSPVFMIICDINMPYMTGIQLREKIYSNERLKELAVPFIFMTTGSDSKQIKKAYALSVQGYFVKPNTFPDLVSIIKTITGYWGTCLHPNSQRVKVALK